MKPCKNLICLLLIVLTTGYAKSIFFAPPPIFLHTNKEVYTTGERIWFSGYVADTTNQLIRGGCPLFVQLYQPNGSLMADAIIYTRHGRGSGSLLLAPTLTAGLYRLRAFTDPQHPTEQRLTVCRPGDRMMTVSSGLAGLNRSSFAVASLLTAQDEFAPRQLVNLIMMVADTAGRPLPGTFSLTVYQQQAHGRSQPTVMGLGVPKNSTKPLSGDIGTNRFLTYSGQVVQARTGKPLPYTDLILFFPTPTARQTRVVQSDSTGRFDLSDIRIDDKQVVIYQVNTKRGQAIAGAIIRWEQLPVVYQLPALSPVDTQTILTDTPPISVPDGEDVANDDNAIRLDAVDVRAKKPDELDVTGITKLYETPDYSVKFDEKTTHASLASMISMLPGVQVIGSGSGNARDMGQIMIRGIGSFSSSNTPLFVVDGIAVQKPEDIVNPQNVAQIDLLSGASAAIYGSNGANGVIVIYTRRFGNRRTADSYGSQSHTDTLRGFQVEKPFIGPDYSQPNGENKVADLRRTLYWNPEISTNRNGDARLQFYTADGPGVYVIQLQGMTDKGPVFAERNIIVR